MCRLCDDLGPICAWHTDPNWMFGIRGRVRSVPPKSDKGTSDISCCQPCDGSDFDGAARPSPGLRSGAARRDVPSDAGDDGKAARDPAKVWKSNDPGLPNPTEVLLYAFLTVRRCPADVDVAGWAAKVAAEQARQGVPAAECMLPAGAAWRPAGNQPAAIFNPLTIGFGKQNLDGPTLDAIRKAIRGWRGAGQYDDLPASEIQRYVQQKTPQGPKVGKSSPPPRWKTAAALFQVAALVHERHDELEEALADDTPFEEVLQSWQREELLEIRLEMAEAETAEEQGKRQRLQDTHRKALGKLGAQRGAVGAVRKQERAAAANKVKAAKVAAKRKFDERLSKAVERKVARTLRSDAERVKELTRQLKLARARARDKKARAEVREQSAKRLARAKAAERRVRSLQEQLDEVMVELNSDSDESDAEGDEPAPKLARRDAATGRFQAEPWQFRVLTWAQLGRRVSPCAINANISDVFHFTAGGGALPGELPPVACERELQRRRGEVTVAGEAMAAFRVALSKRIVSFGFDESTKFGLGLLSSNTQIETAEGKIVDVVLRGATLTAGGTAEKVSKDIETKLFAHGRKLLEGWRAEHERRFGAGSWAAAGGPEPSQIGLHRLAENAVIMSDTCNGARLTKRLVVEMAEAEARMRIGEDAWALLSNEARELQVKVWVGDCDQHLRNIILNAMANGATAHLQVALEDDLAEFSGFDRMSVDAMDLIRAIFKELHAGGEYAKGKGKEFWAWVAKHYPSALVLAFERANGSRQDLALDGAVPIFANRLIVLEFLRGLRVPGASNQLESFLWRVLSCNEITALLRVSTLFALVISQPMRWLAGKGSKLNDWSLDSSARVLNLAYDALEAIAADGHALLDPDLDPFGAIAAEQPLFAKWRADQAQSVTKAADGTSHRWHERVLAEARSPTEAGNAQATEMVVALAEAMANAGLAAMRDTRRAIADKLTSQDGANAPGKRARVHEATKGAHTGNCRVESNFGSHDVNVRTYRNATTENMSGLTQQMRNHDFERPANVAHDRRKRKESGGDGEADAGGFFWSGLTDELRQSLVEYARLAAPAARAAGRVALQEQEAEKLARREERVITLLNAAVEHYAHAKELFKAWQAGRAKSKTDVARVLDGKPEAQQLEYLRKQIEMRVLGCGWTQYETRWSSNKDARIGTVAHLKGLLEEIILDEISRARFTAGSERGLPTVAAPPHHAARETLTLGTMDADALEISKRALFSAEELEAKAEAEMRRRLEAGISDAVEDLNDGVNGGEAPPFDQSLVGKWLEVRWKYFDKDTKEPVYIWSSGKVVRVADGLTDKRSPRAQKLLPAGMVLWAWEADPEFDEPAGQQWLALLPAKWNKQQWYGWRYDPREFGAAPAPPERPRGCRRHAEECSA